MKKCCNCGKEIEDLSKFCQYCGVNQNNIEISAEIQIKPELDKEVKKKKHKIKALINQVRDYLKKSPKKIITGLIVLIIVIAIVIFYFFSHCSHSGCNNSNAAGSRYCYTHKCNICDDEKMWYSDYCYYHYCLYDDDAKSSLYNANSDLRISNVCVEHNSLYTVVTGTITNNGTHTYEFVRLKGSFKDYSGTVLDTASTYAVGSEGLSSGESKSFRMSVDKNYNIDDCDITITDYE